MSLNWEQNIKKPALWWLSNVELVQASFIYVWENCINIQNSFRTYKQQKHYEWSSFHSLAANAAIQSSTSIDKHTQTSKLFISPLYQHSFRAVILNLFFVATHLTISKFGGRVVENHWFRVSKASIYAHRSDGQKNFTKKTSSHVCVCFSMYIKPWVHTTQTLSSKLGSVRLFHNACPKCSCHFTLYLSECKSHWCIQQVLFGNGYKWHVRRRRQSLSLKIVWAFFSVVFSQLNYRLVRWSSSSSSWDSSTSQPTKNVIEVERSHPIYFQPHQMA